MGVTSKCTGFGMSNGEQKPDNHSSPCSCKSKDEVEKKIPVKIGCQIGYKAGSSASYLAKNGKSDIKVC